MSCSRFTWPLTLKLRAPFASTGVENERHGIDAAFLRNERGEIVISGDQIKGMFRHFLAQVIRAENEAEIEDGERLVRVEWFFNWFGRPGLQYGTRSGENTLFRWLGISKEEQEQQIGSLPGEKDDLGRGRLTIRDLVLMEADQASACVPNPEARINRTRIRVHAQRRSVEHGSLAVREQFHRTGKCLTFAASKAFDEEFPAVILYAQGEEEGTALENALDVFLRNLPEIGALKAQGFGEVLWAQLGEKTTDQLTIPELDDFTGELAKGTDWKVALTFSDPILVEPELATGNVQASSSHVSGAVLKAAIAEFGRLADKDFDKVFGDALSAMTIRFARPVPPFENTRPQTPPLSLMHLKAGGRLADYFGADTVDQPIAFIPDMKRPLLERIESAFGLHAPDRVTRTRTAIELGAWHAADAQLFNYNMCGVEKTAWLAEVHCSADDDTCDRVPQLLAFLASGALQIGKTRATIRAAVQEGERREAKRDGPSSDRFWRVTLQTPAAIFGRDAMARMKTGQSDLRHELICYFSAILGADLAKRIDWERFDFLARHRLSGGHRAVRASANAELPYFPFLLTEAGSVFVFRENGSDNDKLAKWFEELANTGLSAFDRDWSSNPFVAENGYGEVRVQDLDMNLLASLGGANA